jgi:hypothetical protein
MLKIKQIQVIDVNDWDELVSQTYGKPYSFQQQDGCKPRQHVSITVPVENPEDYENDSIPEVINGEEMGVSFKAWLERDPSSPLNCTKKEAKDCAYYWGNTDDDLKRWQQDKYHINMFYERNFYPHEDMIINDLHAKGLLPAGEYNINIDW